MTLSTRIALFVVIALAPVLLDDLVDVLAERGVSGKATAATVLNLPAERQVASIRGW